MIFDQNKIDEVLKEIDKNITLFIGESLGYEVLSDADKLLLESFGIDTEKLAKDFPPYKRQYLFGKLSALLGEYNTRTLEYKDFFDYLKKRQFQPLSDLEKKMYEISQRQTYSHIKSFGNVIRDDIGRIINQAEAKKKLEYEKIVSETITKTIFNRETVSEVVSEIGHKTGLWQRDLGRIAETEMNNIFQQGVAQQILEKEGQSATVYKNVYQGACRHCIRLYLKNGIGSEPRLYKLSTLYENGTNIGLKVDDWKAVIGSTHPFCRCNLRKVLKGQVWNEESKQFEYPKEYKSKITEFKIHVRVGDKTFSV